MTSLGRVQRKGLAAEAADLIRTSIIEGGLEPGEPLLEAELADQLGVSRGSVREGLAILSQEGLVKLGWHKPAVVIPITHPDAEELYQLRAGLDRIAASLARKRTADEKIPVTQALAALRAAAPTSSARDLLALDLAFHDAIYHVAGNGRLQRAWAAIRTQVQLFQVRRLAVDTDDTYSGRIVAEHEQIHNLLHDGDRATLEDVCEEHVMSALRILLARIPVEEPEVDVKG